MSFLVVVPEFLTSAAADVENIGSTLRAANAAAAASTTALAAAGADEVSAAVAALFARFGQEYQAVSAQASAFHQQFVQTLNSASGSYAARRPPSRHSCRPRSTICWARSMHQPKRCWGVR